MVVVKGIFKKYLISNIKVYILGMVILGLTFSFYTKLAFCEPQQTTLQHQGLNQIEPLKNSNDYVMNLTLDTVKKTLSGWQNVKFINKSDSEIKDIYFHIYPNAFEGSNININKIKVDNKSVKYKIEGIDKTLLHIQLNKILNPNSLSEIYMDYKIKIPECSGFVDKFGYSGDTYNLGNFYPIVAVYDGKGWDKHTYVQRGDPFYSVISNYKVTLTVPKGQIIATTGHIGKVDAVKGNNIWHITANAVRDYAFVSSSLFVEKDIIVEGTVIKSYARNIGEAEKAVTIGSGAIKFFNKRFGKYPYPTCSIVQNDVYGMEYPNLVMVSEHESDFLQDMGSLEFMTVHELAHQWWYGIVGNNEYTEAWIDEPLAQYSSLLYYKDKYGSSAFDKIFNKEIKAKYTTFLNANVDKLYSLDIPLDKFGNDDYFYLIYLKGTMMQKALNDQLGDAKYNEFLKLIFERYKFKIVTGQDLIKFTSSVAKKDMKDFYRKWLEFR